MSNNGSSNLGAVTGVAPAIADPTPPPPAQFRIVLMSFLAAAVGLIAGVVAYLLYKLIGLFTNLFFFHQWSATFRSVQGHHLGPWVILEIGRAHV